MPSRDQRHLPFRARSDRRSTILALLTVVVMGAVIFLGETKFPLLGTVLEWIAYAGVGALVLLEVAHLVHSFRRRRRNLPPVPPAPKPKTEDERTARSILGDVLMEHPQEVSEGRARRDLHERLRAEIENAEEMYFFFRGENNVAAEELHRQLIRILGGGDPRALDGYTPKSFDR